MILRNNLNENKDLLYLASASPRRKELLESIGVSFRVVSQDFDENSQDVVSPEIYVRNLSEGKARAAKLLDDARWVCGVDTVVYFDGEILGKPKSREEAEQNILRLSGQWHKVYSGVTLLDLENKVKYQGESVTNVKFCELERQFIDFYLDNRLFDGYAGGYAIQGVFACVVEKIEGSYSNVVGLPLELLYRLLRQSGFRFI
ncbi:MAG: nucleoside triphosphate pyrophosphatase [Spirochaetota bacterium]|nr:nucleoside triphosphate pyrophosphatase [Spirochaetota bacterium]